MVKNSITVLLSFLLLTYEVQSQDLYRNKKWDIRIVPEFYMPFMAGDITFSGNQASLTQSLNYGGLIGFHVESEKWFFLLDFADIGFNTDFELPITNRQGTFSGNYSLIGFSATMRATKWLKAGIGGRFIIVNNDLFLDGEQLKDSNWPAMAPIVVLNFYFFRNEKWRVRMGTDIGGFGINSIWTYYLHPKAGYRITKLLEIDLGLRYMSFSMQAQDLEIKTDIDLYGLDLGFVFHL